MDKRPEARKAKIEAVNTSQDINISLLLHEGKNSMMLTPLYMRSEL